MKIMARNLKFIQKWKFFRKIENLSRNRNFWSIVKILAKHTKFVQRSKCLFKNKNFGEKLQICPEIDSLVKNRNFWSKILYRCMKPRFVLSFLVNVLVHNYTVLSVSIYPTMRYQTCVIVIIVLTRKFMF